MIVVLWVQSKSLKEDTQHHSINQVKTSYCSVCSNRMERIEMTKQRNTAQTAMCMFIRTAGVNVAPNREFVQ